MYKLLLAFLTIFLCLPIAIAQKRIPSKPKTSSAPASKETVSKKPDTSSIPLGKDLPSEDVLISELATKEIIVPVEEGKFIFKNLKINEDDKAITLSGRSLITLSQDGTMSPSK